MNIVLVGCGRVGSKLATLLDSEGHEVQIVDINEENFKSLPANFNGFSSPGIPIDQDVLRAANIGSCDAIAAVTPNDNTNIMIGQLAKEIFDVPKILVRISDPMRELAFSDVGLKTICPTNLTVAAAKSAITDAQVAKTINFGTNTISFTLQPIKKELIGTFVCDYKLDQKQNPQYMLKKMVNNLMPKNTQQKEKEIEKEKKKTQSVFGILHENNEFELYHDKELRFVKGDQVAISTLID